MPNGGINVEEFVDKYFTKNNLIHLNNSLMKIFGKILGLERD